MIFFDLSVTTLFVYFFIVTSSFDWFIAIFMIIMAIGFLHGIREDINNKLLDKIILLSICVFYILLLSVFYFYSVEGAGIELIWFFFAFFIPLFIIFFPIYHMIILEYIKETALYERLTKTFSGREVSRWGSVKSYFDFDITTIFRRSVDKGIKKTTSSPLFIGSTIPEYDYKIGGRDIGTTSEQHLITVAGTGAGKIRDAINNNLLTYCGGLIALDVKGEHTKLAYERRLQYAPCYIVDPYGITGEDKPKSNWNPLNEIDPENPDARGDLKRIAEAIIMKERDEQDAVHFREIPQILLRGYMAHVLTTYPEEQRNLCTVFDLFTIGDPDSEEFNPEAVEKVVEDMAKNNAIGGAPSTAASKIMGMSNNERSGHFTSLSRALDWINDENIRNTISAPSDFSVKDCKTKNATIFFVIRENRLKEMSRFIRLFYTICLDQLNGT